MQKFGRTVVILSLVHEQWDGGTVVSVKGEELSIRNALSNFVRLEGCVRILWIARTTLEPDAVSYVYYPWPGKMEQSIAEEAKEGVANCRGDLLAERQVVVSRLHGRRWVGVGHHSGASQNDQLSNNYDNSVLHLKMNLLTRTRFEMNAL